MAEVVEPHPAEPKAVADEAEVAGHLVGPPRRRAVRGVGADEGVLGHGHGELLGALLGGAPVDAQPVEGGGIEAQAAWVLVPFSAT